MLELHQCNCWTNRPTWVGFTWRLRRSLSWLGRDRHRWPRPFLKRPKHSESGVRGCTSSGRWVSSFFSHHPNYWQPFRLLCRSTAARSSHFIVFVVQTETRRRPFRLHSIFFFRIWTYFHSIIAYIPLHCTEIKHFYNHEQYKQSSYSRFTAVNKSNKTTRHKMGDLATTDSPMLPFLV